MNARKMVEFFTILAQLLPGIINQRSLINLFSSIVLALKNILLKNHSQILTFMTLIF